MRTTAAKRCDSHGWYYRDFGIHPDHMASFGYLDKDKYPEIWEVEIEPDENQEGIGEDWDSCEYFGYVDYPIHPNPEVNLKGYPGGFDENGTPVHFKLVQRNFLCYHIQFPYGYKAAESRGKHYRLKITPIKRIL